MQGLVLRLLLASCLAAVASAARAAPVLSIDIRQGDMAAALAALAQSARMELLYDHTLVRGLTAPSLRGRLSAEDALSRLLAGSSVGYRITPEGAFVLFPLLAPRAIQAGDGAVAELLVVGRRTQNVDIRRTQNDIQPYRVFGRSEIETAARDSVDEFLRARETANAQAGPLALRGGEPRSSIDLRGFGETSTLVLVDGRRMPFAPSLNGDFNQADIGGVPPGAVERIEVLTTTAGGIYGPGAVGGVVNVVLRRAYRGADLTAYVGGSDRGDAGHFRLEGRLGFTPDHGDTDVMLFVAHGEAAALPTGRRDYAQRSGRLRFRNDPDAYAAALPIRNGVSVASLGGSLTLDPAYGGEALGASYTYLPVGFSGSPAEAAAQLVANAGKLPLDLPDDPSGGRAYIASAPSTTSGLLNVRRKIGTRAELFFDGFYFRNTGRWAGTDTAPTFRLAATAPGNPFGQDINLSFPLGPVTKETTRTLDTSRWTAGAIVDLPEGWKASADFTMAQSVARYDLRGITVGLLGAVGKEQPGPNGEPVVAPFGDWPALVAALPAYVTKSDERLRLHEDLRDVSLRFSGPLLRLPGGALTATLVGEDREDRIDQSRLEAGSFSIPLPWRAERVRSGYFELRAPLGESDARNMLLRGLMAQLAVRHDQAIQSGPKLTLALDKGGERFSVRNNATTFTAGARVEPFRRFMLRASFATGERLPTLSNFQGLTTNGGLLLGSGLRDPRRAGRAIGSEGPWTIAAGGSTRVGSAQARSFTTGAVINPDGHGRPRLSLDYSRIEVSRQPAPFPLTPAELLAAEAQYPDRVIRAPLTAQDEANGLTVGRVSGLDISVVNAGRTVVEAVDAQFDWQLPENRVGDLRLYGAVTWQPRFDTRESSGALTFNRVGYADGPLEWRGNAGVEWVSGPLSADLNVQYYGSYRVTVAAASPDSNAQIVRYQGAGRIAPQVYVDLSLKRLFSTPFGPGPLRTLEARLSVQNLLDQSPPILAWPTDLGFSEYGDPRRRRVTAALSARF